MLSVVRALYARVDRRLPRGVPDLALQFALCEVGYMLYRLVRGWIDQPNGAAAAFQNGRNIIDLERSLHFFIEPKVQAFFGATSFVGDAASWIYLNAQLTITMGALAYIYLRHNRSFYFVRNMFMVSWVIALVSYILYPSAPPRFFPEWGFVDSVADFTGVQPTSAGVNALFNPYAAVPSMHVAFSLMIAVPLALLVRHRVTRWFWMSYPAFVTFVIVVTGNHFLTDAVLGAVTAGAAWAAATQLARVREQWAFEGTQPAARGLEAEPVRVTA
jgi:membrane-associated phospholipid phosphatase